MAGSAVDSHALSLCSLLYLSPDPDGLIRVKVQGVPLVQLPQAESREELGGLRVEQRVAVRLQGDLHELGALLCMPSIDGWF